ncbi:MAG: hypothetical protein AAF805_01345 [Planctomycetota bacterium]
MSAATRGNRRRRLLHDGAAETTVPASVDAAAGATRVRYTPREGSVSFAVAAGVSPRSVVAVGATVLLLAGVSATLLWADSFGVALATTGRHTAAADLLMVDKPGSLASWWTAVLWLAFAAQAVLVFGMRRHRTDDLRGGYGWWAAVALAGVAASVASATPTASAAAAALAAATGFSPMPGDAFWWFAPVALAGLCLYGGSMAELRESLPAAASATLAALAALAKGVFGAGLLPETVTAELPVDSSLVAPSASMIAASAAWFALVAYAGRIVRETVGEVAPPQPKPAAETKPAAEAKPDVAPKPRAVAKRVAASEPAEDAPARKPSRRAAAAKKAEPAPRLHKVEPDPEPETNGTQWVSGGDGYEEEDYGEATQRRRLSKAERKRLRKLKARRAA